jgi:hypothetical protein
VLKVRVPDTVGLYLSNQSLLFVPMHRFLHTFSCEYLVLNQPDVHSPFACPPMDPPNKQLDNAEFAKSQTTGSGPLPVVSTEVVRAVYNGTDHFPIRPLPARSLYHPSIHSIAPLAPLRCSLNRTTPHLRRVACSSAPMLARSLQCAARPLARSLHCNARSFQCAARPLHCVDAAYCTVRTA